MCQLELNFEDDKVDYDDVMNMFKKLNVTKQRKVLNYFFDHTDRESKIFNCVELGKYMNLTYDNKNGSVVDRFNRVFALNKQLHNYMRGFKDDNKKHIYDN